MAFNNIKDGNIDAVDALVDEVQIPEVVEVNSDFYYRSKSHLNFINIYQALQHLLFSFSPGDVTSSLLD